MFLLRSALIVIPLLICFQIYVFRVFSLRSTSLPKEEHSNLPEVKIAPCQQSRRPPGKGVGAPMATQTFPESSWPGESHPFLEQRGPSARELGNTRLRHPVPPPHTSTLGPLPQPHVRRSHWLSRSSSYIGCLASNCPFVFSSFFLPLWVHVL